MEVDHDYAERVSTDGSAIVEGVLSSQRVDRLRTAISSIPEGAEVRRGAQAGILTKGDVVHTFEDWTGIGIVVN